MTTSRWAVTPVLVLLAGCGKPQMGTSEETFKTVDALYTAVTAHDVKLLDRCAARLAELDAKGDVGSGVMGHLQSRVFEPARAGEWQSAAESLYAFMTAQRRDGPRERPEKRPAKRK